MTACLSSPGRSCRDTGDPSELSRLSHDVDSLARALRSAPDTHVVWLRQYMQAMVDRTASLDHCGRIASAGDLRSAAKIGVDATALGLPTVERAYQWARRAVMADSSDRRAWRLMATAWDQLQVMKKQPQWFATVITCAPAADARCTLPVIDTTRVTDPQRVELGLNTLAQQRATVDSLNRARGKP
jgi:hypothetical protein